MREKDGTLYEPLAGLVSEDVLAVRPYIPGKPIEEVQRELGIEQVIKLASNENNFGASPRAQAAITEALSGIHIYPDGGCYYLKRELASHLNVSADSLIVGNGSDEIIALISRVFVHQGDEVIVGSPSFLMYQIDTQLSQGRLVRVPLKDFCYDADALIAALSPKTKVIFICNPNNPTGTIMNNSDLERLVEAATARDIVVVSDEAYHEYVETDEYPDSLALVRAGGNIVVLRTFSKIHGLAGLRVGYGVARPSIISILDKACPPFNVNTLAQVAARASLSDPGHVEKSKAMAVEGKQFLYEQLGKLGVPFVPSQTNFILVETGEETKLVIKRLLEGGVIVRGMAAYDLPHHIRVTIGRREENEAFVRGLQQALN